MNINKEKNRRTDYVKPILLILPTKLVLQHEESFEESKERVENRLLPATTSQKPNAL